MVKDPLYVFDSTLVQQGNAISNLAWTLNAEDLEYIIDTINSNIENKKRIFTTGVGKSGNVASKVSSTMTSTGTPTHYLCPLEAMHGGLGICGFEDTIIVFSKSGETSEILEILPYLKKQNMSIFSITCNTESTLARSSCRIISYQAEECCGTGFIPTTSTTVSMAIGDALAMSLMCKRGFTIEDFAKFHPGGSLGQLARDSVGKVEFSYETSE